MIRTPIQPDDPLFFEGRPGMVGWRWAEGQYYPTGPDEGLLIVTLWPGRKSSPRRWWGSRRTVRALYQVISLGPAVGVMGHAFALNKRFTSTADDESPADEGPYTTVVGPNAACTCKSSRCKLPHCRHRWAMSELVKALNELQA